MCSLFCGHYLLNRKNMKKILNNFSVDALCQTGILLSREELKLIIGGNSVKYGNYGISLLDDNGNLIRYVSYSEMGSNGGDIGSDFENAWGYNPNYGSSSWGWNSSSYGGNSSSYNSSVLSELSSSMLCYMDQHNIGVQGSNPLGPSENLNHNYNANDNTIHLNNDRTIDYGTMVHEFTHAFQQNEGMTGDRIYREFQSYMAQKLAQASSGYGYSGVFSDFATNIVDVNGYVNMSSFYSGLAAQYEDFKNSYPGYYRNEAPQGSFSDYNFNWEKLFNTIGIRMK